MKEYIHYGHKYFDINLFNKIKNVHLWTKPSGGLWASPVDAEWGWKDYCDSEQFRDCNKDNCFKFTLTKNARVFHIYNVKDLGKLPKQYLRPEDYTSIIDKYILDFECISNSGDYDAIELHLSEETDIPDGHLQGLYYALYGWDCDSILIMNPDIIVPNYKM